MSRKSFGRQIIDAIDELLSEEGTHTISIDNILDKAYEGKSVHPTTRQAVQQSLSRFGNILRNKLGYDITVIGEHYTVQRHLGLTDREQGQRCLPTCSEYNKPWGLHTRTGPDDQISNAAYDQTKSVEYGIRRTTKDIEVRGLSNKTISSDILNVQEREASQRFPIPLSTTHTLLPSTINVIGGTSVYLKWVPNQKQLTIGKKDVKSEDAHNAIDDEEESG